MLSQAQALTWSYVAASFISHSRRAKTAAAVFLRKVVYHIRIADTSDSFVKAEPVPL